MINLLLCLCVLFSSLTNCPIVAMMQEKTVEKPVELVAILTEKEKKHVSHISIYFVNAATNKNVRIITNFNRCQALAPQETILRQSGLLETGATTNLQQSLADLLDYIIFFPQDQRTFTNNETYKGQTINYIRGLLKENIGQSYWQITAVELIPALKQLMQQLNITFVNVQSVYFIIKRAESTRIRLPIYDGFARPEFFIKYTVAGEQKESYKVEVGTTGKLEPGDKFYEAGKNGGTEVIWK